MLGEYCALAQFIELSRRELISGHDLENTTEFIELAKKQRLTLASYNAKMLNHRAALNYISNVYTAFDSFLHNLYGYVRSYGVGFFERNPDTSLLLVMCKMVLTNVEIKSNQNYIDLCEYYRLIRNRAIHALDDKATEKSLFKKVTAHEYKKTTKYKTLEAPNTFANVTFDDFMLFAKISRTMATLLYDQTTLDYGKIIAEIDLKKFSLYQNHFEKCKSELSSYLDMHFKKGFEDSLDSLTEMLLERYRVED